MYLHTTLVDALSHARLAPSPDLFQGRCVPLGLTDANYLVPLGLTDINYLLQYWIHTASCDVVFLSWWLLRV